MTQTSSLPHRVSVLPGQAGHLPEVHRMLVALAAHHGDQATITPTELARLCLQDEGARLLVACLDGSPARHPLGYALLLLRRNMITGRAGYEINQLFVQAPFRRLGLGRALITAARSLAAEEGRTGLTIGTHPANEAAAAAYRAMGLTELPPAGPRFAVEIAA
jgi:GNAT superfamily N-acetyltransferase